MKKLKMVEKDGQKVPFYAADGKGKMKEGGKVPVIKAKKGPVKRKPTAKEIEEGFRGRDIPSKEGPSYEKNEANRKKFLKDNPNMTGKDFAKLFKAKGGMMKKKGYAKGGKVRGSGIAKQGVRAAKMVVMKGS
jgi:hypothetical protein